MAEVVGDDIIEQILVRSDVDDLMRYKCVCKSWLSLISNPVFIKKHLSLSPHKDRNNNLSRRIVMSWLPFGFSPLHRLNRNNPDHILIMGSVNGLVCLITPDNEHIFIDNPCIRHVIKQRLPPHIVCPLSVLCAGFGYDSLTDDYKVILGSGMKHDDNDDDFCICFYVLSLKANVWKTIRLNHYKPYSKFGVLCNGALHWFMKDCNEKAVIVSFDLSKEEFKEKPQPDDLRYEWKPYHQLGIMNQCLSIYNHGVLDDNIWIMNNYDDKQPNWVMLPRDCEANCQVVHVLCSPKNYMEYGLEYYNMSCESDKSFQQAILDFYTHEFICSSLFVQSLISPHMFKANNEWE